MTILVSSLHNSSSSLRLGDVDLSEGEGVGDWVVVLLMQVSTGLSLAKETAEMERTTTKKTMVLIEVFIIAFCFYWCVIRETMHMPIYILVNS